MRLDSMPNKPSLLMLGDHFPDPDGCVRAARAWHLLNCASDTHEVYLSAVTDRPVNLSLWRRVAEIATRVHIAASNRPWVKAKPFSGEAVAWVAQQRFDALLATGPNAWPNRFPGDIGIALCDITHDTGDLQSRAIEPAQGFSRLLGARRRRDSTRMRAAQIIPLCDHLLVTSENQAQALQNHRCKAVTLPDMSAKETWARLFTEDSLIDQTAHTLSVIPVKPGQARQAA